METVKCRWNCGHCEIVIEQMLYTNCNITGKSVKPDNLCNK